jgi:hypothetical protein
MHGLSSRTKDLDRAGFRAALLEKLSFPWQFAGASNPSPSALEFKSLAGVARSEAEGASEWIVAEGQSRGVVVLELEELLYLRVAQSYVEEVDLVEHSNEIALRVT